MSTTTTPTKHAVLLGASKGTGYHTLLNLLTPTSGWSATLLLRKPEVIETDSHFKEYLEGGRLRIVKGDATSYDDVKRLFVEGGKKVDVVISSVGGLPGISWKGFTSDQPRVCTETTMAILRVIQELDYTPRVIAVSAMGIGKDHKNLPMLLRVLYSFIEGPHQDKRALEWLLQRASTVLEPTEIDPLKAHIPLNILKLQDVQDLKPDFIPEVIIIRPALMMGDGAMGEKIKGREKTKVAEGITAYTINRAEVGRVIVEECLPGMNGWVNKSPTIAW